MVASEEGVGRDGDSAVELFDFVIVSQGKGFFDNGDMVLFFY